MRVSSLAGLLTLWSTVSLAASTSASSFSSSASKTSSSSSATTKTSSSSTSKTTVNYLSVASSYRSQASSSAAAAAKAAASPSACAGNTPANRASWCSYNVSTNYYDVVPNTGVTREYWFNVEQITAAPDGVSRMVMAINGSVPGPTIIADWGDTVKIHVTNNLDISHNGTSIHFHGIRQNYTNQHDGVVSITQCPTPPGSSHTYSWRATQYGVSGYENARKDLPLIVYSLLGTTLTSASKLGKVSLVASSSTVLLRQTTIMIWDTSFSTTGPTALQMRSIFILSNMVLRLLTLV